MLMPPVWKVCRTAMIMERSTDLIASDIFFNIPGDAENNGGTFDYENGMALDPFLFTGGPDFSDAGHLFDEFVTF